LPRLDLRGRVVVVTGAAKGIGRATALELSTLGAQIAGCDVDSAALETTLDKCRARGAVATLGARVDVGEADQVQGFAEQVERELGATYCLVNNAGVGVSAGFFDTEPADWDWLLRVNLGGTINGVRAFAPFMQRRGVGSIVNVASASGYCNLPGISAYGATKYAVVGLSEALRAELLPSGVTVGVVCPGIINTSILDEARIRGVSDVEAERRALQTLYQRRGHAPEIVAAAIVRAIKSGRAMTIVTSEAWLLYVMKRLAPTALPWLLRASQRLYQK
jgi:NAD(P)-dependent dehydrogenase (short-subunit alcohol dehydrogenase family)